MNEVLYIYDMPLSDLGLYVTEHPGWLDGPEFDLRFLPVPGAIGGIVSPIASTASLGFSVTALVDPGTLTGRETTLNDILERIPPGLLQLRWGDQDGKVIDAIHVFDKAVAESPLSFVEPDLKVTLTFMTPWPFRRDAGGQIIAFGSTATSVPLGTLPSGGTILLMGSATNPTVTYRAASGESVETLGITLTLASTDFLELDLDRKTIYKNVSGTRTRVDDVRSSGYFFTPDPRDGAPAWDDWPTLEVDAGSGLYLYHRHWSL